MLFALWGNLTSDSFTNQNYKEKGMCVLVREASLDYLFKVTGGGKDNKIVIQMQLNNTFGFGFVGLSR